MGGFTDFLFARPSFWEGVARILDFGGTLQEYNVSASRTDADLRAIEADWRAIGEDMKRAIDIVIQDRTAEHANGQKE